MKKADTFNIYFYIKRTRLLKNGQAPIYMRITTNGERSEISTKLSVEERLWDQKKERAKGNSSESIKLNHELNDLVARVREVKREIEREDQFPGAGIITYKLGHQNKSQRTLTSLFNGHICQCREKIGNGMSPATVTRYETVLKHLLDFVKVKYGPADYPLKAIDHKFIKDFEHYLRTVRKCGQNSTAKYLNNFKTFIRIALANEWIKKNPFDKIKIRTEEVDIEFLTEDEINVLIEKDFSTERLSKVKDIYLFCCFTGCAYADAARLTLDNIVPGSRGQKCLKVKRKKTNKTSLIPIKEIPESIIAKYKNDPFCQVHYKLLPMNSNQKYNEYLKEVASICGIEKNLTTHTARHTFATLCLTSGVPIEVVSSWLGHSNLKMTQHYAKIVESLSSQEMDKVASKFTSGANSTKVIKLNPRTAENRPDVC